MKRSMLVPMALGSVMVLACSSSGGTTSGASTSSAQSGDSSKPAAESSARPAHSGRPHRGEHAESSSSAEVDTTPPKEAKEDSKHAQTPAKDELADDQPHVKLDKEKPLAEAPKPVTLEVPDSRLRLTLPAGWHAKRDGEWWMLSPKSNKAVFSFVEFDQRGEATEKLGEVARLIGAAGNVTWDEPKWYMYGPDKLVAHTSEGTLPGWDLFYATINPRDSRQVLAFYATAADAADAEKSAVRKILGSLRLRP
jgi:hypothetical protein